MTYEFQYLMHLLGAAAKGTPAEAPRQELNWEKIFAQAQNQMLTPLICQVLDKQPDLGYPVELVREHSRNAKLKAMKECAKRLMVINLLSELEKAGFRAVVVKGSVAAINYASPENRFSTDTDICIDPADEEKVCDFLSRQGFEVSPRWQNGHHAVAKHPAMGVLEVHVKLYDEIVEDVWFAQIEPDSYIQEPYQKVMTAEGPCYSLGNTDHLIFIILHMIKHFILAGMCLRMMMDTALFFAAHKDDVDIDRVWTVLHDLKFDRLLTGILWSMIHYCGFMPEDFPGIGPEMPEQVEMLLTDLETGGFLGHSDAEARLDSRSEFSRRLLTKKKSKLGYWLYMIQWQHSFKISTLFPGRKRLARQYPYLEKHPWLLPVAWIHRLIFRGGALLKGNKLTKQIVFDENKISDESKARVELFKSFDMI